VGAIVLALRASGVDIDEAMVQRITASLADHAAGNSANIVGTGT
jgi:hypothetical protein